MIALRDAFWRLVSIARGLDEKESATPSQLLRLPPEILLLIASMLPTPDSAFLALSCRQLKLLLGSESPKPFQDEPPDVQLKLLFVLAKDLLQHFVCQECIRLHRIGSFTWPRIIHNRFGQTKCTHPSRSSFHHLFFSRYRTFFPQLHLAMKQHFSGQDIGFPLQAFQSVEVELERDLEKTTLVSVNAQIISDEFLMRSQTWILVPWSRRVEFIDWAKKNITSGLAFVYIQVVYPGTKRLCQIL